MGMLNFFKISNGIANSISFTSKVLGTGTYSGHVGASKLPDGHGVFINELDIEYDGEWKDGKLCGFGRKYAKGYYDMTQEDDDEPNKSLFYAGEFKDDRFHGKGKFFHQSGKVAYDGDWEDGWKSGEGTEYYANGSVKYVGTWKRDRYNGSGVYTYENGDVIKGEWRDGLLEGYAELSKRDGCVYKRFYKHNEVLIEKLISGTPPRDPDSMRTLKFDNGVYEGELGFTGKMHGKGVFSYTNGDRYEGGYNEGLKHGKGVFTWADGMCYDGEYENDMRSGKGIFRYTNGDVYEGEWKDNVKNGQGIFYYKNGDRYEGGYSNSLKEGHGVYYYQNGNVFEGEWQGDKRHGEGILTCFDGRKKRQKWDNDKLVSDAFICSVKPAKTHAESSHQN
ncbi:MAG: hypothetical protein IKP78_06125 [Ruminococcus sp.]|nr:hypothetical protein [Ruminococcus sp.]